MITVAYIGFGVSVREYHIPYAEKMENVRIKYVMRRKEDIPQFAEYEPYYLTTGKKEKHILLRGLSHHT